MHNCKHLLRLSVTLVWLTVTISAQTPQPQPLAVIPFELNTNHIFLKVNLNNAPLWFILDTGAATSVMDMERAKALGLALQGTVPIGGAGSDNATTGAFVQGASLKIGGLEGFTTSIQVALPLTKIAQSEARLVDGILGYEFFSRYAVQLDYAARKMTVYEAKSFTYTGSGEVLPLTFKMNHPHTAIKIEAENGTPIECDALIDTGARSAIILARPYVEQNQLIKLTPKTYQSSAVGAGLNGISKGILGRLKTVRLGNVVIDHPVTTFSQDEKGVFASTDVLQGNIGGEILRRFRVTFDYAHKQMILEATAATKAPYEFDMSGLFLRAEGAEFKTIKVLRVQENSPASEIGIIEGDEIIAINGMPVAQFTLEVLRQMFRKDQMKYTLEFRREEKVMKLALTTRRLI